MASDRKQTLNNDFNWDKVGWVLVILNLLAAVNSTLYFTTGLKAGLDGWLAMNSCAPSIFIFALGYIIRNRTVMAVGSGLMFRFGTVALFLFSWEGMNIIPQISHIFMTFVGIYFIVRMVKSRGWNEIIVCVFVAVLMIYAEWQMRWLGDHPKIFEALFRGDLNPGLFK